MLDIIIQPFPEPIFLFPSRPDTGTQIRDDTLFQGQVTVTCTQTTRIGGIRAVWYVGAAQCDQDGKWDEWEGLQSYVIDLAGEGRLEPGDHKHYFQLVLPADLPPSSRTPYDSVSHTLFVSILAPVPDYSVIPTLREQEAQQAQADTSSSSSHPNTPAPSEPGSRRGSIFDIPRRVSSSNKLMSILRRSSAVSISSKASHKAAVVIDETPDEVPMPLVCGPSLYNVNHTVEVVCAQDPRGELRRLDWSKQLTSEGIGDIELHAHSELFVLGSGFNLCVIFSSLSPTCTLHGLTVTLEQRTSSSDGSNATITTYELVKRGLSYFLLDGVKPDEGDYIWRGEIPRMLDAESAASEPLPQPPIPDDIAQSSNLVHLKTQPRIPSTVIGGLSTSPPHLTGISKTTHVLRAEISYSKFGLDKSDNPLSAVKGRVPEGAMRHIALSRDVEVGGCMVSPVNIVVPPYTASAPPRRPSDPMDLDIVSSVSSNSTLTSFTLPRTMMTETPEGRRRKDVDRRGLAEKIKRHKEATGGECVCFLETVGIGDMVGSYGKKAEADVVEAREWIDHGSGGVSIQKPE